MPLSTIGMGDFALMGPTLLALMYYGKTLADEGHSIYSDVMHLYHPMLIYLLQLLSQSGSNFSNASLTMMHCLTINPS